MLTTFKQIKRGCGSMPHVGDHPGIPVLVFFVLMGALAGLQSGSFLRALVGSLFIGIPIGAIVMYGAHGRATYSQNRERKERVTTLLQNFVSISHLDTPLKQGTIRFRLMRETDCPAYLPYKARRNTLHIWVDNTGQLAIPDSLRDKLQQALTVDGIFAIPQSLETLSLSPKPFASAHDRFLAEESLEPNIQPSS